MNLNNMRILNTAIMLMVNIVILFLRLSICDAGGPIEFSTQAQIESLYSASTNTNEREYINRFNAANYATRLPNLDTSWAVSFLINGIDEEIKHPMAFGYPTNSYGTYSQSILRQYVFSLQRLGQSAWGMVLQERSRYSGYTKDWITLALGCQGVAQVHEEVRNIFINSQDANIKAMAARCLNAYKDTLDMAILISEFYSSLNNSAFESKDSLSFAPHRKANMVAEEVAGTLSSFGYVPEWDSLNSSWRLVKK